MEQVDAGWKEAERCWPRGLPVGCLRTRLGYGPSLATELLWELGVWRDVERAPFVPEGLMGRHPALQSGETEALA